jgi:hypothetical protein
MDNVQKVSNCIKIYINEMGAGGSVDSELDPVADICEHRN